MGNGQRAGSAASRVLLLPGVLGLVAGGALGVLAPSPGFASGDLGEAGGALLGAAVACAGLGGFAARVLSAWSATRRRRLSSVGRVMSRSTRQRPGQHRDLYQRVLRVSFAVGQQRHELEWAPSHVFSSSRAPLDRIDEQHPDGSEVTVFYEAEHPANAGVRNTSRLGLGGLGLGAIALAMAYAAATFGTGFIGGSVLSRLLSSPGTPAPLAPAADETGD